MDSGISLSLGGAVKNEGRREANAFRDKNKNSRRLLHESDSEEEHEEGKPHVVETITVNAPEEDTPIEKEKLVIKPPVSSKTWRGGRGFPSQQQVQHGEVDEAQLKSESGLVYGLNKVAMCERQELAVEQGNSDKQAFEQPPLSPLRTLTDEERARVALLSDVNAADDDDFEIPVSAQDAMKQDLKNLPDAPDMESYSRIPVESFGAALLRGMGWKGDLEPSNDPGIVKRPAFLGIGAKPAVGPTDEKKRERADPYIPLMRVQKERGDNIESSRYPRSSSQRQSPTNKSGSETPQRREKHRDHHDYEMRDSKRVRRDNGRESLHNGDRDSDRAEISKRNLERGSHRDSHQHRYRDTHRGIRRDDYRSKNRDRHHERCDADYRGSSREPGRSSTRDSDRQDRSRDRERTSRDRR
jgi:hypothetical protein